MRRGGAPQDAPVAVTTSGRVAGRVKGEIVEYRGIPFAAAPVGARRWRAPQPVERWDGVRPSVAPGPAAHQLALDGELFLREIGERTGQHALKTMAIGKAAAMLRPTQGEDCLNLNVRAPVGAEALPVMVWIHGGDHVDGSKDDGGAGDTTLPQRGMVMVSVNYRLGLMGWFVHPELAAHLPADEPSANFGLLDLVAALRWVNENIAAFGGDPDRVTLCGQSAGADLVLDLMVMPAARDLFHGTIVQSPGIKGRWLRRERAAPGYQPMFDAAVEFADRVVGTGPGQIERLRAADAKELQGAYRTHYEITRHFRPTVDGLVLPETTIGAFAGGRQAPVPMIVGANAAEGAFLSPFIHPAGPEHWRLPHEPISRHELVARLRETFGDHADAIAASYPGLLEQSRDAVEAFLGDRIFNYNVDAASRDHAAAGHPTWRYRFDALPPSPKQTSGAHHAAETQYVFDSFGPLLGKADDAHLLANEMGTRWAAFVRTGDPAVPGRSSWPQYRVAEPLHMRFDRPRSTCGPVPQNLGLDALQTWSLERVASDRP